SATSCRGDHVDLVVDQISCKGRQPIVPIFCKTVFNRHVTAIDIARFTQATAERRRQVGPIIWPQAVQETDHRHRQLLRARRERPRRRRAGHERDELAAATHSITSSARKRGHSLSGFYLPSFQISAASFQSLPIFSHTTRYLPVTSFGIGPLVLRLKVPISRAADGPSGLTSRVVSFGSLTCSAMLFHSAS